MPKLVASAIKFYPIDSEYPQIVCGKRHCDCFEWMFKHQVEYDKKTHEQGFLTDTNEFVDRYEATKIAWHNHQILTNSDTYEKIMRDMQRTCECLTKAYPLFSEDLW